ncbi:MAG TPA: glutathione synthase, partial [Gammaproteobacteria bacterium]|nr:glutathione synthase [Gammaproteobacteria bacterium]
DSTLALLLAAKARGIELYYLEMRDLSCQQGQVYGHAARLEVFNDSNHYFTLTAREMLKLTDLDVILMRVDPPVEQMYVYTTQLLDLVEKQGVLVVNKPGSLRDVNEKLFINWFAQCCPPTLFSANAEEIMSFIAESKQAILKPLHGMGGASIFKVDAGDLNTHVIIETLTQSGQRLCCIQRFIPEIAHGDKRILMIDGEPVPYALARIPKPFDFRGNLAAGASNEGRELTARDREICRIVGPVLQEKGLLFVGLDVIGDYLTEVNVTSPTCIRELDKWYHLNIADQIIEKIIEKLA